MRAPRLLLDVGGIDLAASLAYFTTLSLFPLIALVVMGVGTLGDPEDIADELADILVYYFPTARDLIRDAVRNLLGGTLAVGLVAVAGMLLGANGLLMAAGRALNRVFGRDPDDLVRMTVAQWSLASVTVLLFLLSLVLTAVLHLLIGIGERLTAPGADTSPLALLLVGAVSTALPLVLTTAVFALVYRRLPAVEVRWGDAAFGAMVAIVLFEAAKHVFFWLTSAATQTSAVYGPITSVVVLMMWAYLAGLIFLYGAAVTRLAGELRP